jgi:phosphatidylserine decarboxylase
MRRTINLVLHFVEMIWFALPDFVVECLYINPHYKALRALFSVNTHVIQPNQTFLIIGGALYPRTYKALLKLGVPDNNIFIWDFSLESIQKTMRYFPNMNIEHKMYDYASEIRHDNVIVPLAFSNNNADFIRQCDYNVIIHDYIHVFYNSPLVTYYSVYFGVKKLSFIPSKKNYIIHSVQKTHNIVNTLCFLVGCLADYSIPFLVSIYKLIYPPSDNVTNKRFSNLRHYFLRNVTIGTNTDNKTRMPCCGVIKDIGIIQASNPLFTRIKGENVHVNAGYERYINIFIRPNDYHFIHSPISGTVTYVTSYSGIRSLLMKGDVRRLNSSIAENTKVIIQIQNENSNIMIVMIGGLFVGSIQLLVKEQLLVHSGDKVGYFNFGSSVLLLHNETEVSHRLNDFARIGEEL